MREPIYKSAYMYAHRGEGDTFHQAFSQNVRRLQKQRAGDRTEVGPIPVICGGEPALDSMQRARRQRIDDIEVELANCTDVRQQRMLALGLEVAREMQLLGPDALAKIEDPENTEIVVLHHGSYEGTLTTAPSSSAIAFSIEDLPRSWKSLGMPLTIGSIDLSSCESGDAGPRRRFVSYAPGYSGSFSEAHMAPGQRVANKMKALKFTRCRVVGYQGQGMALSERIPMMMAQTGYRLKEGVALPEPGRRVQLCIDGDVITDIADSHDASIVFEPMDSDRKRRRLRYNHAYVYASSAEGNVLEFAIDENIRRLVKWIDEPPVRKPRGPIAVLAPTGEIEEQLTAAREKRIDELADEVQSLRQRLRLHRSSPGDDSSQDGTRGQSQREIEGLERLIEQTSMYLATAEATEIVGLESLTAIDDRLVRNDDQKRAMLSSRLDQTKIYIPRPGSAGSNALATDHGDKLVEDWLDKVAYDLGQYFARRGIAPRIGSFRLPFPGSADTAPRRKFESRPRGYGGFPFRRCMAPGQYLANKLEENGFVRPRVSGYQGRGVLWTDAKDFILEPPGSAIAGHEATTRLGGWGAKALAPCHAVRIAQDDWKSARRRSTVAREFRPQRGCGLLCL
ncbi:MAG TPA: hypothetical protein VF446_14640 [Trinickia sp.]